MAEHAAPRACEGFPDRPRLRQALARALAEADPELRIVASGFRAETSEMDLLAIGSEGELVSIRHADAGEDAAELTRALSDLGWLRARREDLRKLAPQLGIEALAEPRSLLLCRDFERETRTAAAQLPAATIELWVVRRPMLEGEPRLGLEPLFPARSAAPALTASPVEKPRSPLRRAHRPGPMSDRSATLPLTDPPSSSAFRTGLRDSDLERLTGS